MNWKEFKEKVESAGVTDDMELWYIDVSAGSLEYGGANFTHDDKSFSIG